MKLGKLPLAAAFLIVLAGAIGAPPAAQAQAKKTLVLGAYTTPREAYGKLLPLFAAEWKKKTGETVTSEESYLGSGAQSRAVVEGFEADVVALSLEADVTRIQKERLITRDWKSGPTKGMVSRSVVAFAVRKGNPKRIRDWADLAKPGVEVLTPNPKTSGGAMWNVLGAYGAALRGKVAGVPGNDPDAALGFLKKVLANVTVMDKAARESITSFEKGIGDVAITYENEVLVAQQAGEAMDLVLPSSTILIENPIAVVDVYAGKHGSQALAEAFVAFVLARPAQELFAQYGLRSVDPAVETATAARFPKVPDLFTIEQFGGWEKATTAIFGPAGVYTRAITEVQSR